MLAVLYLLYLPSLFIMQSYQSLAAEARIPRYIIYGSMKDEEIEIVFMVIVQLCW